MTADGDLSFGEWLRRRRGSLGLTQAELARQLSCAPITLRKIEAEERFPSPEMAARLANSLQLPTEQIALFIRFARGEVRAGERLRTPVPDVTFTIASVAQGVPLPPNATLGRDAILTDARMVISERGARLISLIGPPGVGKTRLTLALMHQLHSQFADGAVFVELTSVGDHENVAKAVAEALKIKPDANGDVESAVRASLRDKRLLLALDNFEHVLEAAPLVSGLLANCAGVCCIVSSREPLAIPNETVLAVEPLALPTAAETLEELARNPAVALFVARAAEVSPGFELTTGNASAIGAICRKLDGLPLALELAAARVKMLAPADIAARLDDALSLLTRQHPSGRAAHPSLRAALAWSEQLLTPTQRELLCAISIFAGSFTLEMAEAVAAPALKPVVLDTLEDLLSRSLLASHGAQQQERRFRLLDAVRQFSRENLSASADASEPLQRWLRYAVDLAMRAATQLKSTQQNDWFNRLALDLDNLRVALRWACDTRELTSGLHLAAALEYFWLIRGNIAEGLRWLIELLKLAAETGSNIVPDTRATALHSAGVLAYRQGNLAQARFWLESSLREWQVLDHNAGIARANNNLGNVALDAGDYLLATRHYQEALALHRKLNNSRGIASVLNNLGFVQVKLARFAEAQTVYQESLALYRNLGDLWSIASSLSNLGETARRLGDFELARTQLTESFEIRHELGDERGMALVQSNQAMLAISQGNWAQAAVFAQRSLNSTSAGDEQSSFASAVEVAALLEASRGEARRATRLYAYASKLRQTLGMPLTPTDAEDLQLRLDGLRTTLGSEVFAALCEVGKALTPAQVLADVDAIDVAAITHLRRSSQR